MIESNSSCFKVNISRIKHYWGKRVRASSPLLLFLLICLVIAPVAASRGGADDGIVDVYYFYGEGCPHCSNVEPILGSIEDSYPVRVHRYEVYGDGDNLQLFNDVSDSYGIPLVDRGVPTVFVGDRYFVGDVPLEEGLVSYVEEILGSLTPPQMSDLLAAAILEETAPTTQKISFLSITAAAIVDAANPCSIAILVFLIGVRGFVSDQRKRALRVGLAFCLSFFIAYLMFGLGLLAIVQVSGYSGLFRMLVGLIAILAGVLYLKDVFWYGLGGFTMEVPRSLKPLLVSSMKRVTSPAGAFLMGLVASSFELPCTGGPYLLVLGQLADKTTRLQAVPMLLYYNAIFVLPLVIITLALYSGVLSTRRVGTWNEANRRTVRFLSGVTTLLLGLSVMPIPQLGSLYEIVVSGFRMIWIPFFGILFSALLYASATSEKIGARLSGISGQHFFVQYLLISAIFVMPSLGLEPNALDSAPSAGIDQLGNASPQILESSDGLVNTKPPKINIQIDVKTTDDAYHLQKILSHLPEANSTASVFFTEGFARENEAFVSGVKDRGYEVGLLLGEEIWRLGYDNQLDSINASVSYMSSIIERSIRHVRLDEYVVEFSKLDNFLRVLQELELTSVTAHFIVDSTFRCWQCIDMGYIVNPMTMGYGDVVAIPIGLNNEEKRLLGMCLAVG